MKLFRILASLAIFFTLSSQAYATTWSYQEDTTTDFLNPEKGFYSKCGFFDMFGAASPATIGNTLYSTRGNGSYIRPSTLLYSRLNIPSTVDGYTTSQMTNWKTNLRALMNTGVKLVYRPRYSYGTDNEPNSTGEVADGSDSQCSASTCTNGVGGTCANNDDCAFLIMFSHIDEIGDSLRGTCDGNNDCTNDGTTCSTNDDCDLCSVIDYFEMGMVGRYGEWYKSTHICEAANYDYGSPSCPSTCDTGYCTNTVPNTVSCSVNADCALADSQAIIERMMLKFCKGGNTERMLAFPHDGALSRAIAGFSSGPTEGAAFDGSDNSRMSSYNGDIFNGKYFGDSMSFYSYPDNYNWLKGRTDYTFMSGNGSEYTKGTCSIDESNDKTLSCTGCQTGSSGNLSVLNCPCGDDGTGDTARDCNPYVSNNYCVTHSYGSCLNYSSCSLATQRASEFNMLAISDDSSVDGTSYCGVGSDSGSCVAGCCVSSSSVVQAPWAPCQKTCTVTSDCTNMETQSARIPRDLYNGGCLTQFRQKMGYKFVLNSASLPITVSPSSFVPLTYSIRNDGFSHMINKRKIYLTLLNKTNPTIRYDFELTANPRLWKPGGQGTGPHYVLSDSIYIPADAISGTYIAALWLPDIAPLLQYPKVTREIAARYSVRFSNIGMWDPTYGFNKLGEIQITEPVSGCVWRTALDYTQNFIGEYTTSGNSNYRSEIAANLSSYSGSKIRITMKAADGAPYTARTNHVTFGLMTTDEVFDSAPTVITFNTGQQYLNLAAGQSATSDDITFTFDKTKRYGLHVAPSITGTCSTSTGKCSEYSTGTQGWCGVCDTGLGTCSSGNTGDSCTTNTDCSNVLICYNQRYWEVAPGDYRWYKAGGDDLSQTLDPTYGGTLTGIYGLAKLEVCDDTVVAPCGNGSLDNDEECDDGNTTAGDGCSATCTIETGYTCSQEPSICVPTTTTTTITTTTTSSTTLPSCNQASSPTCAGTCEIGFECLSAGGVCACQKGSECICQGICPEDCIQ